MKKGRVPRFPLRDNPVKYLGWLRLDPKAFNKYKDIYENETNLIFIKDNTADLDLEPEAKGNGNDRSDKDGEDKELPSLEELEDLFSASTYNHLNPIVEDVNEMDSLAKGIDVAAVPQAI
ncbi:hypothetical protein V2W45_1333656 [Cenococcum geophilum]